MCKIERMETDLSINQYIRKLRREGFRKLGSGAYASAFAKPNGRRVYRVGELYYETRHTKIGNYAYLEFLKEAIKHKNNPWFPKVYKVVLYGIPDENHKYLSVYMERLYSFGYRPLTGQESSLIESLIEYRNEFIKLFGQSMERKARKDFEEMLRVMERLQRRYGLDMHNGNIMRRKNGQFVITDPVA